MTARRNGQCLCGAVGITVTDPAHDLGACHCRMCRRWTGSAFVTLRVPVPALQIRGADQVRAYRSSSWATRSFCGTCGATLWYRADAGGDYYIAAGLLDDLSGMRLEREIYIDCKPDAFGFAGPTQQMTEAAFLAALGLSASPEE